MNNDLISREALKKQIIEDLCKRRCPLPEKENYCNPNCSARLFIGIVNNAPTPEEYKKLKAENGRLTRELEQTYEQIVKLRGET